MKSTRFALLACSLFFTFLAVLVFFLDANRSIFLYLNSLSQYTGDFVWANLTLLADALVAVTLLFPFIRKKPELVWSALIAFAIAALLVHSIKPILSIPRPPAVFDKSSIHIIGPAHRRNAFPSGHSATIFTLVGVLTLFSRSRFKFIGLLAAVIISLSRIMVGVHWPLDVCMGAAIGCLAALGGFDLVEKKRWAAHVHWQQFIGAALLIAAVTLLVDYHSGYEQALWLQRAIALSALSYGGWEYARLLRH
jgi:membrane-associated phospholipid phosphatase